MHACCMLLPNIKPFTTVLPNASICDVFAADRKYVEIESNESIQIPPGSVQPCPAHSAASPLAGRS